MFEKVIYGSDPERVAIAREELQILKKDLARDGVLTEKLARRRSAHKRIFTAVKQRYVRFGDSSEFLEGQRNPAESPPDKGRTDRRGYFIDPWGQSYWILYEKDSPRRGSILLYSLGPDRRREIVLRGLDARNRAGKPLLQGDDIGVYIPVKLP